MPGEPRTGGAFGDALALDPLLEVMAAAGRHDADACLRHLAEAESHLGPRAHTSRPDIALARDAVADGDWRRVWSSAWAATCGLTWAFPPDPEVCPPAPTDVPITTESSPSSCGVCGHSLDATMRFCPSCGTPTS